MKHVSQISSLDAIRAATAARTMHYLYVRLYYAAVQNLIYGCGHVPQPTTESSDTPPIHCAQHVQQSIDMYIQLPAGLQYAPVQMAEVINQEYVFVSGA